MKFAPKERAAIHRRLARELLWNSVTTVTQAERDRANSIATTVLNAIEDTATSKSTLHRAVMKVIEHVEEVAS